MNKKLFGLILSLILGLMILIGGKESVAAQAEDQPGPPVDQIIVKYRDDANLQQAAQAQANSQMQRLNAAAGVSIDYSRPMSGDAHVLRLEKPLSVDQAVSMTARLAALPEVEYAEPDYRVFALGEPSEMPLIIPNDTRYYEQWHYFAPAAGNYGVNAPAAWDITKGANNVYIAVLDTGITNHADLAGRWIGGYDLISDSRIANDGGGRDSDPHDPGDWITSAESSSDFFYGCSVMNSTWHGTHVGGTIGAATNNDLGVAGLNWVSKFVPVRVLGKCGNYTSDIADGIRWAAGLSVANTELNLYPARVINMSLGGSNPAGCSDTYQDAIDAAYAAGSIIVVSAGNAAVNASLYQPASCNHVITVAATNRDGGRASYSNYGDTVEISAPGGDSTAGVLSTLNTGATVPLGDTYAFYKGTSMSAPHVSGVASLMFSLNPTLTPNQVLTILQNTATAFPSGSSCNTSNCGSGIVNAAAALLAVPDSMPGTPILSAIINPYGDSSYTVNWNDVPNADTYRLQEDDNISFSTPTTVSNILISSYDVSGKPAGTWYYRVQSINSDGASTWSNAVSTTVKPQPPVLDAINNPTNEDAYLISWSSQAGADGYILLEADNDFSGATTKYQGTDTSYLVTGQAGGNWYYKVRAYNGVVVGNLVYGDLSNIKTVTVKYSTLDAPNLLAISNPEQESSFTVSWIAVPTATSYILEESDTPYFVDPVVVYNGALTQALLEDREGGSLYYRVRAVSNTDQGPWSNSQFTEVQRVVYLPLVFKNLDNAPDFPTTFNSVADTCVLQGYPSENYGDYLDMLVGYDDSFDPDGEIARSFVMFDLSEIPNGTYISQAMLYLYLTGSYDFLNQSRTVTIYRAGSPWSEMKVTWYSQPAIQEAYGTASVTHGQWGWYAFNVKGLVSGWVNDTWPNYGLAIRGPEHSGYDSSWKSFFTRESDFAPYIEVSYSALAVRETQSLVANTVLDGPNFLESFSPQAETGKQLLFVNQSE